MPSAVSPPSAPASKPGESPEVPATNKKRKIVCFSDTGHILFNTYGCGSSKRELLDSQINPGERTFKDVSEEMRGSLNVPFEDGLELMSQQLEMDPGFEGFHRLCVKEGIPFHMISAGLKPALRRVLDEFLGEEDAKIDIVANEVRINEDGSEWKPVWRHGGSELGHDKAVIMKEAREADVLFARKGLRLEGYCVEHGIKYLPFDRKPARFNPRANMRRRVSSRHAVPRYVVMTPKEERVFLWPEAFS
ncbi:putative diketo-5-methylthio-1-phosphopentane phosphatase [Triangularia setosa]|uniref:Diketo-5-methylthio-1-phosphopentane phosphatase n=1 Tax=Triangularia setosa TaxID=2587417 RepID=A0AAN7A7K0_9PEZI|nr:putative diketo-5-methylthio-1-phosphopentane phosphatase [Podospora setosa]